MKMKKTSGFTLAEVLITLGIIGVVAAMTIPTLMNQSSQAVFRTGFKKAVSVLNQAITMNVALNDSDFSALTSGTDDTTSVVGMFKNRLNTLKTASGGTTDMGTNNYVFNSNSNYVLYLSDGMTLAVYPAGSDKCATIKTDSPGSCRLVVDVNGIKGPNTLSTATDTSGSLTDQYVMTFYNQQIVPGNNAARYALYGISPAAVIPYQE